MNKIKMVFLVLCLIGVNIQAQKSNGKIHGYMFGDYFYNLSRDTISNSLSNAAFKGDKDFNGFQFRRIYFGYDYKINNSFSTRFRLEASQSELTNSSKMGLFVKDAYLKWHNIFKGSDVILGISPVPTFSVSEKIWGYRSLLKTIMDLRKVASSRDFGIALKGKLNENGSIKYWVMAGNGEGNRPEDDKQKRIYAHINFEPVKNLNFTLYGDIKFRENIASPANHDKMLGNNVSTTAIFVGYKEKDNFSLGLEMFYQNYQNELITSNGLLTKTAMGISLFGYKDFSKKISLIARYDYFDPTSNNNYKFDKRNLILGAVNYKVHPDVWIMPNIVIENYDDLADGKTIDSSITARFSFFYKFK